ncbi:MAG: polymer-forming cytoskeletal protein [Sphingomonas sp.]|uniref:bactofilin family protein n=1 Tax=Sphingomonas sp. TaxID=28214 RepID=UPI001AD48262|nr:polymer-forming cytoskeletal protein [Sphingomonas sp.]MBN8815347.1 polymer-forming cytoskeletal protein [Sphingomonas sp.]
MFNKRAGATTPSTHPAAKRAAPGGFSVIGPDVLITGNVQATADLHIEGRIQGDLNCGNLVLGPDAVVNGQVRAETARIGGTIEGSVAIRQLIVESGARITGDVEYESVSLENGAQIDGRMKHTTARPTELKVVDTASGQAA